MTPIGQYNYTVEPFSEDYRGYLAWSTMGNLLLRASQKNAGDNGFGFNDMMRMRHVWVLSRFVLDFDTLPRTGEAFTIETWVGRIYRQFTDRHFAILRPDGTAYGHAYSIWALINVDTRQPMDFSRLPDGGFAEAVVDRENPIAPPSRFRMTERIRVGEHTVRYSDLDINGHCNSVHYITLLLDYLADLHGGRPDIHRVEMAYCLESYLGDCLEIFADRSDKAASLFEIRKAAGGEVIVKALIK